MPLPLAFMLRAHHFERGPPGCGLRRALLRDLMHGVHETERSGRPGGAPIHLRRDLMRAVHRAKREGWRAAPDMGLPRDLMHGLHQPRPLRRSCGETPLRMRTQRSPSPPIG